MPPPKTGSPYREMAEILAGYAKKRDVELQTQRAVVTGFDGVQVFVRRNGQSAADTASYPVADGLTLLVGDEVVLQKVGSGWIVQSRIVSNRIPISTSDSGGLHLFLLMGA